MQDVLKAAVQYARPFLSRGRLADYIPALTKANPDHLGVTVTTPDGRQWMAGDTDVAFSIQSVSKIFALALVLRRLPEEKVFERVGMEPSGNPFYSLVQLEYESGKPRNPLINAGAIAVTSLLPGHRASEKTQNLLEFIREVAVAPASINEEIYQSEASTSHRNRAVGHFMKHFGVIEGDVEEAVDAYFRQCSIELTCARLSRAGLFLAHHGVDPVSGQVICRPETVKLLNAIMSLCGLYDASGEFACRVGLPGKSGVGGGILAIAPEKMSIATFGPALDEKGNSIGGLKILEFLSRELNLSIFAG